MNWTYTESDPAMMLFTASVDRFGLTFPPGSSVLELGCGVESDDWCDRMARMDPTLKLTRVDVFPQGRPYFVTGDACNPDLFPAESFDRIVLLGSLEHFGLGFYGDPLHNTPDGECIGDTLAMVNVAHWLKPGGFVYFDVPCNPTGSIRENRHFRTYAPGEVEPRLLYPGGLKEIARGYSWPEPNAGSWLEGPPTEQHEPYWFVAVLAQKVR